MSRARGIDPALVVILAGVSAALHVGKLPPALPVLREALGVSLLQAGFLLSLVQLAGMSLGLAVGLTADGLGLRRSVLIGLGVLCAAGLLGGWAAGRAARPTCWGCARSRASVSCWSRCPRPAWCASSCRRRA